MYRWLILKGYIHIHQVYDITSIFVCFSFVPGLRFKSFKESIDAWICCVCETVTFEWEIEGDPERERERERETDRETERDRETEGEGERSFQIIVTC